MATLAKVAADAATVWQVLQVEHWYSREAHHLQIASNTAVSRYYGLPAVPIQWVLTRGPAKSDAPVQALSCIAIERTSEHIIAWFVCRRCVETTFAEV